MAINKYIYWIPRILSIVFILFLSMFGLDVFENNFGFWRTMLGLFMHLIPSMILIITLIISWKYEWVGGTVFICAGLLYIFLSFRAEIPWYLALSWSSIIAIPAITIGILFFANWRLKDNKRLK